MPTCGTARPRNGSKRRPKPPNSAAAGPRRGTDPDRRSAVCRFLAQFRAFSLAKRADSGEEADANEGYLMLRTLLLTSAAIAIATNPAAAAAPAKKPAATASAALPASNPFAKPSMLYMQAPDFSKIKDSDYLPAILAGMAQQKGEITQI